MLCGNAHAEYSETSLPVGHGGVEYLVGQVLDHFVDEGFLHGGQLLRSIVLGGGGELFLPRFARLGIAETDIDRHAELHLRGESVGRHGFVELVVTSNLACDM